MIFEKCEVATDDRRHQLLPQPGTPDFPCAAYCYGGPSGGERAVPWHWHEEVELIRAKAGKLRVRTPGQDYLLGPGELVFINSNVLHDIEGGADAQLESILFHPLLLTGWEGSVWARKYLRPLFSCTRLASLSIPGDCAAAAEFSGGCTDMRVEPFGYEFSVRTHLGNLCLWICEVCRETLEADRVEPDQDAPRIRAMLDFIHGHYAERLTLGQIARSADVGERECLRCFQREIQTSPMQYLLRYRVTRGAELLRREDGGILDIALRCGFESPSRFSQIFKRFFGCTPRAYRKLAAEHGGENASGETERRG